MDHLETLRKKYSCGCDETAMYQTYRIAEKGEGMHLWFEGDDEPYIDLVMGFSSINYGHSHPEIIRIVKEAAEKLGHVHSFNSRAKLEFSELLNQIAECEFPVSLQPFQIHFNVGGSNAVDSAVLLARHVTGKSNIIRFDGAFHGCNHGAAWLSDDKLLNKSQYLKLPGSGVTLPYPDRDCDNPDETITRFLELVDKNDDIAAIIIEPVLGAGGVIIPDKDVVQSLTKIARERGIIIIDDEIQMGIGRTGPFYAMSHYECAPDIILLGKALSAGYAALSGVLAPKAYFDAIPAKGTAFQGTFANHIFGINVAYATVEWADKAGYFMKENPAGEKILSCLHALQQQYKFVRRVRGIGMAFAFDLVNPVTQESDDRMAQLVIENAFACHVVLYACGVNKNVIKLLPPITITEDEADIICERLKTICARVSKTVST